MPTENYRPGPVPPDVSAAPDTGANALIQDHLLQDHLLRLLETTGDSISRQAHPRLAALAADLLATRPAGRHCILVGDPETPADATAGRMPVVLLAPDIPFLVDSATAVISSHGLEIHDLFHPLFSVRRDAAGRLTGFCPAAASDSGNSAAHPPPAGGENNGEIRESLVVMDVDSAPAALRETLAAELGQCYDDLQLVADDQLAMQKHLATTIAALQDAGATTGQTPDTIAEARAFLGWLAADNFTLLGLADGAGQLGIARNPAHQAPASIAATETPAILVIHTTRRASTLLRHAPLDIVSVRRLDGQGRIAGETRLLGLFTNAAMQETPHRIPWIRRKAADVRTHLGHQPSSHSGRMLDRVIENFPREELFRIPTSELLGMAEGLLSLLERPRPYLFAKLDPHSQTVLVLVYIPRDSYSAHMRRRITDMLAAGIGGTVSRFDVELRADPLARLHFTIDGVSEQPDEATLNRQLLALAHGWEDRLEAALASEVGAARAAHLRRTYRFGRRYQLEFSPEEGAADTLRLASLPDTGGRHVALSRRAGDADNVVRVKIFKQGELIALSDSVPMLENFGFHVIEELPYHITGDDSGWIHDQLLLAPAAIPDLAPFCARLNPALAAVLAGACENDPFNTLITSCGLTAEEANWLRAWFRYLRQTGSTYGVQTVVDALLRNEAATRALITLFRARHDQHTPDAQQATASQHFDAALQQVQAIDDDRILRQLHSLVAAILRTNAFVPGGPETLAFKLDPARIPGLPKPVLWREIWVCSPRVEGVHLRGGPIARGGLRWSDRRDDFRTEVLGLVKAQMVKNSVIVPTGAKGGFYAKQLPDPAVDRDGWLSEGREAYKLFIRALLSVTDNLDEQGKVVPPAHVVRLDDDDPYLVVAADKGTARFSDTANAIAEEQGFWLGDAFASGGSAGYDHKGMGITARGAWVSVTRHFAELGTDVQTQPITVAGVGDMSGDVFGNGMLRSKALRLVAAFDHRHIFLDPAPDPAASWAERARLYALPRSSWADYDPALISAGGGVWPRTQKAIPLSPAMQALLGVEASELSPAALMSAILQSPVDLLWFGGIGTYIKGAAQTNAEVGDHANDMVRVNGGEVRARVIGEGANLGVTQAGRIEYARRGGHLNADFIDNSAGVDTSDHEVNIKIALGHAERVGGLTRDARNQLLHAMTDEVADLVLADNRAQTLVLSVNEARAADWLGAHARLIDTLEASGRLDPVVEGLPTARELAERRQAGRGLTRPELAILMSYAKMDLKDALAPTTLGQDALLRDDLFRAFPAMMHGPHAADIDSHQLRAQIVATKVANLLVNRGGIILAHELAAEHGVSLATIAAAFVAARALFDLEGLWAAIDAAEVPATVTLTLHAEAAWATRGLVSDLAGLADGVQPAALVKRLRPGIGRLANGITDRPALHADVEAVRKQLALAGAPTAIGERIATLVALRRAPAIVALAADCQLDEVATARAYARLGEALGIDWAQTAVAALTPADGWERLLAAGTASSFDGLRLRLIRAIATPGADPAQAVDVWLDSHAPAVTAVAQTIAGARQSDKPTLAMLAHLASVSVQRLAE